MPILILVFLVVVSIGLFIAWRRHVLYTKKKNSEILAAARKKAMEDMMSKPVVDVHTILKGPTDT